MMKFNILPAVRTDRKDEKGFAPIYIKVYEGKRVVSKFSIGYKVKPEDFAEDTRRVKKSVGNASLINSLIDKHIADLKTKILTASIVGTSTEVNVSQLMKKEKAKDMDFYEFAEQQIKEKNYAAETRRNYSIYILKLKAFRKTLKISEVPFQFLQKYEAYLRDELKNSHNTIWGNFKFINTMTNDAIKSKYLVEDPFKTFNRVKYKQTDRTFLEAEELERIEKFVAATQDEPTKRVGMMFLFMANTGLRYSDAIRFNSAEHVLNNERIVIETQKTKKLTNIYINEDISLLIQFIESHPLRITQVDFNGKLKIIAAGAGVNKKVSSHVARHSFGSLLADKGVPMEVAKGLLAHGSMSSTKIYFHVKTANLDEAMKGLKRKENGNKAA
jgi:integrase/recombinase XerD